MKVKKCDDCRGVPLPGKSRCARCRDKRRLAYRERQKLRENYTPIDEKLERPRSKLLRAARRFGWVEAFDLFDACGVPPDPLARNAYSGALSKLVRDGCFVRRVQNHRQLPGKSTRLVDVRITDKGKAEADRIGWVNTSNSVAA